jgi:malate synthase
MVAESSRISIVSGGSETTEAARLKFAPVEGAKELFTPEFVRYLLFLHDVFTPKIQALRRKRAEVLGRALNEHILPGPLPASEIRTGDWKVSPLPEDLKRPGIEISGPASITGMFINGLNPGPEGTREFIGEEFEGMV